MGFSFKFYGGTMDGRIVRGDGDSRDANSELALRCWIESRCGTVGHHFHTGSDGGSPAGDVYEVVGRSGSEKELLVVAACRSHPKD